MKVLDGLRAGKKPREIAVDIYGADEVRDGWYNAESWKGIKGYIRTEQEIKSFMVLLGPQR